MVNEAFILLPLMLFVVLGLDRYLKWNAARLARERQAAEAASARSRGAVPGSTVTPPPHE
jgi:hypothetical protein